MSKVQDENTFESRMLKALHALTRVQVELMNAQVLSTVSSSEIGKAWDLLWKSVHSCASLATAIRHAEAEQALLEGSAAEGRLSAALPMPVVAPESAYLPKLARQLQESLRSVEEMCRHTADFYESLIDAGQGDSDAALSVSMCRLYGHSVECLLETVKARLPMPEPIAN